MKFGAYRIKGSRRLEIGPEELESFLEKAMKWFQSRGYTLSINKVLDKEGFKRKLYFRKGGLVVRAGFFIYTKRKRGRVVVEVEYFAKEDMGEDVAAFEKFLKVAASLASPVTPSRVAAVVTECPVCGYVSEAGESVCPVCGAKMVAKPAGRTEPIWSPRDFIA